MWSPTPQPIPAAKPYLIKHGAGYTLFEHRSHEYDQQLLIFVPPHAPVKIMRLRLTNRAPRNRCINVTCYAEWVLGPQRATMGPFVLTEFSTTHNAILARNPYNSEFSQAMAFLGSTREPTGLTTDRAEFLGVCGDMRRPAALERMGLINRLETSNDPCAALQTLLWVGPGETKEVTFLLGEARDREDANDLLKQYRSIQAVEKAWRALHAFWERRLNAIEVHTPEFAMDLMLNRWLLYQALACRIWGRTALYQSSGAFGFRDQLQDVLSTLHCDPAITRRHILDAACRQFETGDVLHWWHPPSGRGVRTRCSDDLLWLPYAVACYIEAGGDFAILDERLPFLNGEPLRPDEHERYDHYFMMRHKRTLFEHCCLALERGATSGAHGLPLMGSHDWNDGFSQVGRQGRGESVWNAWFIYDTLNRFAALCDRKSEPRLAARYRQRAEQYRLQTEQTAWDGAWYLRAFYDNGAPMGSAKDAEARIDLLPQAWGVISGGADPARRRLAMEAVWEHLVQQGERLVLLFTPPFDQGEKNPGYIKGYPPGVRENGGQYTHAATWAGWAYASLGQGERAAEVFRMLNPIHHSDTRAKALHYRVEPYVVAADVYSEAPHRGRGGWTWYTGSAGWMYRLGVEAILGLHRQGNTLRIDPCIPGKWESFQATYRFHNAVYHIRVENPAHASHGVKETWLDGALLEGNTLPLKQDGMQHQVRVVMG